MALIQGERSATSGRWVRSPGRWQARHHWNRTRSRAPSHSRPGSRSPGLPLSTVACVTETQDSYNRIHRARARPGWSNPAARTGSCSRSRRRCRDPAHPQASGWCWAMTRPPDPSRNGCCDSATAQSHWWHHGCRRKYRSDPRRPILRCRHDLLAVEGKNGAGDRTLMAL